MNKLVTSGYIAKLFKQADKNTIIRRPNLRRFAEQNDVEYYVHDTAWLTNSLNMYLVSYPTILLKYAYLKIYSFYPN